LQGFRVSQPPPPSPFPLGPNPSSPPVHFNLVLLVLSFTACNHLLIVISALLCLPSSKKFTKGRQSVLSLAFPLPPHRTPPWRRRQRRSKKTPPHRERLSFGPLFSPLKLHLGFFFFFLSRDCVLGFSTSPRPSQNVLPRTHWGDGSFSSRQLFFFVSHRTFRAQNPLPEGDLLAVSAVPRLCTLFC